MFYTTIIYHSFSFRFFTSHVSAKTLVLFRTQKNRKVIETNAWSFFSEKFYKVVLMELSRLLETHCRGPPRKDYLTCADWYAI